MERPPPRLCTYIYVYRYTYARLERFHSMEIHLYVHCGILFRRCCYLPILWRRYAEREEASLQLYDYHTTWMDRNDPLLHDCSVFLCPSCAMCSLILTSRCYNTNKVRTASTCSHRVLSFSSNNKSDRAVRLRAFPICTSRTLSIIVSCGQRIHEGVCDKRGQRMERPPPRVCACTWISTCKVTKS